MSSATRVSSAASGGGGAHRAHGVAAHASGAHVSGSGGALGVLSSLLQAADEVQAEVEEAVRTGSPLAWTERRRAAASGPRAAAVATPAKAVAEMATPAKAVVAEKHALAKATEADKADDDDETAETLTPA